MTRTLLVNTRIFPFLETDWYTEFHTETYLLSRHEGVNDLALMKLINRGNDVCVESTFVFYAMTPWKV